MGFGIHRKGTCQEKDSGSRLVARHALELAHPAGSLLQCCKGVAKEAVAHNGVLFFCWLAFPVRRPANPYFCKGIFRPRPAPLQLGLPSRCFFSLLRSLESWTSQFNIQRN